MKIVLDTNVLVSGLLTPFGNCGEIVRMLTSEEITLCIDSRILVEYEEVLSRPQFNIASQKAAAVIEYIQASAEKHAAVPLDRLCRMKATIHSWRLHSLLVPSVSLPAISNIFQNAVERV